jgi:hypothetical protein
MATANKSVWPKPGEKGWGAETAASPEQKWKQERYYLEQRIARLRGEIRQLQARLEPYQAGSTRSKPAVRGGAGKSRPKPFGKARP